MIEYKGFYLDSNFIDYFTMKTGLKADILLTCIEESIDSIAFTKDYNQIIINFDYKNKILKIRNGLSNDDFKR